MAAVSEQKREYSQWDHTCWTRWWNAINIQEGNPDKNIDFYWADIFPIRTPTVLRVVLVKPDLVATLFRACWEQNLNMASDEILQQVITEAGYDGASVLVQANSPTIKADLRARTKEAQDTGICGVPTYRVFRRKKDEIEWKQTGDLVWGQDELAVVEDLIAGWDGSGVAEIARDGRSRL
jgi:2-hydroxychromene-2-carboxylate isomerase